MDDVCVNREILPPLEEVFHVLDRAWGPQGWWPARTALEMIVGAVLTQNTAWTNVEKALARLEEAGALDLDVLHRLPLDQLAERIRPAGYFNVKARRLRAFTTMVYSAYGGSLNALLAEPSPGLREVLLEVNGVGPETADSILLYAAGHPWFVVDAYTRRILSRHGWMDPSASYDEVAAIFTRAMSPDVGRYGQYHALLVRLAKKHCRTRPECASCPLETYLPREGPLI